MRGDERVIDFTIFNQYSGDGMIEVDIRSWRDLKMEVGHCRGLCPPRINHDYPYAGVVLFMGFNPSEENRVTPRRVSACYKKTVSVLNIFIRNRNSVFAKGLRVACHGTAHTQSRICIDVICADKPLAEFVGYIVFFGQALTRNVKTD